MPGLLPAAKEAAVRAKFERLLPDRATIVRTTLAPDGQGGSTETPTTVATDVPCRVDKDQRMDRELALADRLTAEASYIAMLSTFASRWPPSGIVDIRASDRLVVTGGAGGEYEIQGSGGPVTDDWVRQLRVLRID
jgi:hypothetical protein